MTEEQEEDIEKQLNTDDEDLVNVDGTKVKLSGKLLKVCYALLHDDFEIFLIELDFFFIRSTVTITWQMRLPF